MDAAWKGSIRYPLLDRAQDALLVKLRAALDTNDHVLIDSALHEACFSLFAHERHQYSVSSALGKFYSPVNIFVVFQSLRINGSFRLASEITGICAALEYCIRATMLVEIDATAKDDHVSSFQ